VALLTRSWADDAEAHLISMIHRTIRRCSLHSNALLLDDLVGQRSGKGHNGALGRGVVEQLGLLLALGPSRGVSFWRTFGCPTKGFFTQGQYGHMGEYACLGATHDRGASAVSQVEYSEWDPLGLTC
jgi:hypothetical protein